VRGAESELLAKIADGDWSDETQEAIEKAVTQFAEDFGYDLDEEGHPLEASDEQPPPASGASEDQPEDSNGADEDTGDEEHAEEEETAAQPA
jgi:F-type H+-transporting ATPase subunit alpha